MRVQDGSKTAPNGFKKAPGRAMIAPRRPQDGLREGQDGPRGAQEGPQRAPRGLKEGPREASQRELAPNLAQRRLQDAPGTLPGRSRTPSRTPPGRDFETHVGSEKRPLGSAKQRLDKAQEASTTASERPQIGPTQKHSQPCISTATVRESIDK